MANAAAILDLDRTLIDIDAAFRFARHLVATEREQIAEATGSHRHRLARRHRRRMLEVYAKAAYLLPLYRARLVPRSRLVRASYAFFRGHALDEVRALLKQHFEADLRHRVYPGAPALLDWHRAQGHATAILTSAPQSLARLFADHLGVEHAAGVRLEHVDGRLTGRVREGPLWGLEKRHHAQRLAETHGWALAASYAYTDHDSDVALLEAVGHPVAVHPNPRLRRIAARRDWPVMELARAEDVERALATRPER